MKHLLLAAALAAPLAAAAQESPAAAAERARIAAERGRVEADFKAQERVCWGKFAVNQCLSEAKAKRRAALADLRRQEIGLNDEQRKQRGAERLRELEERGAKEAQPRTPGQPASSQPERDAQAAERAATRASKEADRAARTDPAIEARERAERSRESAARKAAEGGDRARQAAENVRERERREKEAAAHRADVERRLAERQKAPARPLPPPPN